MLRAGALESMPDLVDCHFWLDYQIQRNLGGCELEGQKRKLVWCGSEERWIEHWLGSQVWLHMSGHRS